MASLKDREIFSVGTWRGSQTVTATESMLAEMVSAYNELNSKVPGFAIPIKLGHNKRVGEPAFGYAENVRMSEDGRTLLADFEDMPPEIVDQVQKKQYNAVSVEIWPSVNYAGKAYPSVLGGVALLGAEWPAVKGLKPLSMFAEDADPIQLSKEDEMPFSQEQLDAAVAAAVAQANLSADARVTEITQRADRAEAALQSFRDDAEKASVNAVIEAAEAAGKIVPANKPAVLAMAEAIRLSVDPAKRTAAIQTFKDFVEAMPKKVDFSENGNSGQERPNEGGNASEKVHVAVQAAMKADKTLTYRTATDAVFAADPALKTAYAEENV